MKPRSFLLFLLLATSCSVQSTPALQEAQPIVQITVPTFTPTVHIAVPTFTPTVLSTPQPDYIMTQDQLPDVFPMDKGVEGASLQWLASGGSTSDLELILKNICGPIWGFSQEPIKAQVVEKDFTGDRQEDVLVAITFSLGECAGFSQVFAYFFDEGRLISELLFDSSAVGIVSEGLYCGGGAEILDVRYLNVNRTPEIIFSLRWEEYTALYVKELQGQTFVDRVGKRSERQPGFENALTITDVEVAIKDDDGNGWAELLLTTSLAIPKPMTETILRTEIWREEGEAITFYKSRYRPEPVYRYEAVLLGDFAFLNGDFDHALAFYQQAVFDESLLSWMDHPDAGKGSYADRLEERMRINGYGRYRIMLVHAVEGRASAARVVYENLVARIPQGSAGDIYVQLAKSFWIEYSDRGDYDLACFWTRDAMLSQGLEPAALLGRDFYGSYGFEYSLENLCPYPLIE